MVPWVLSTDTQGPDVHVGGGLNTVVKGTVPAVNERESGGLSTNVNVRLVMAIGDLSRYGLCAREDSCVCEDTLCCEAEEWRSVSRLSQHRSQP